MKERNEPFLEDLRREERVSQTRRTGKTMFCQILINLCLTTSFIPLLLLVFLLLVVVVLLLCRSGCGTRTLRPLFDPASAAPSLVLLLLFSFLLQCCCINTDI